MTIYKAGTAGSKYLDRCREQIDCICYERGDRQVYVDGEGPFCIILDREYFKIEVEGMGTDSSEIEALWPAHACIPIRKKSELESCGQTYKVFNGPRNMHDGWYAATLKLTCESC